MSKDYEELIEIAKEANELSVLYLTECIGCCCPKGSSYRLFSKNPIFIRGDKTPHPDAHVNGDYVVDVCYRQESGLAGEIARKISREIRKLNPDEIRVFPDVINKNEAIIWEIKNPNYAPGPPCITKQEYEAILVGLKRLEVKSTCYCSQALQTYNLIAIFLPKKIVDVILNFAAFRSEFDPDLIEVYSRKNRDNLMSGQICATYDEIISIVNKFIDGGHIKIKN